MALYAFDGTGDAWDQESPITPTAKTKNDRYLTNVVFFYKEYVDSGLRGEYFPGVGSSTRIANRIVGGAFGVGASDVIETAFAQLQEIYESGDPVIDIVGYSRGAAIARAFADKIFQDYKKMFNAKGNPLTTPPDIRFLGVFDTVASFGNPLNNNELIFQARIPNTVRHTFHAMSLDVKKAGFGLDRAYGDNVLEVWFRGGHGDVGGNSQLGDGQPNRARTNIALNFMLQKARAAGIRLRESNYPMDITAPVVIDGNSDRLDEDTSRRYRNYDIFHYSLFDKTEREITFPGCVDLPERHKLVIEEIANESQLSEQRLLQLTPELSAKYPDTQSIYDKLYEV
ncbi:MAG: phospholipase effector Tle1 domain-containing protein [Leptolyngbyaceae cyanobacterium]